MFQNTMYSKYKILAKSTYHLCVNNISAKQISFETLEIWVWLQIILKK